MGGNLRLRLTQDFYEVANADLLVPDQIEESKPGWKV